MKVCVLTLNHDDFSTIFSAPIDRVCTLPQFVIVTEWTKQMLRHDSTTNTAIFISWQKWNNELNNCRCEYPQLDWNWSELFTKHGHLLTYGQLLTGLVLSLALWSNDRYISIEAMLQLWSNELQFCWFVNLIFRVFCWFLAYCVRPNWNLAWMAVSS